MAGKKGMKHKRPKTKEERDDYALVSIESLIDNGSLKCANCQNDIRLKELNPLVVQLMMKRYDKLRATLSSATVTTRQITVSDELRQIAEKKQQVRAEEPKPIDPQVEPAQDHPTIQ